MKEKCKYRDLSKDELHNALKAYVAKSKDDCRYASIDREYYNYTHYKGNIFGCPLIKIRNMLGVKCGEMDCASC